MVKIFKIFCRAVFISGKRPDFPDARVAFGAHAAFASRQVGAPSVACLRPDSPFGVFRLCFFKFICRVYVGLSVRPCYDYFLGILGLSIGAVACIAYTARMRVDAGHVHGSVAVVVLIKRIPLVPVVRVRPESGGVGSEKVVGPATWWRICNVGADFFKLGSLGGFVQISSGSYPEDVRLDGLWIIRLIGFIFWLAEWSAWSPAPA